MACEVRFPRALENVYEPILVQVPRSAWQALTRAFCSLSIRGDEVLLSTGNDTPVFPDELHRLRSRIKEGQDAMADEMCELYEGHQQEKRRRL